MTGNWNLNVAVRVCPENETEKSIVDILEEKDQIVVNKDGESNNFTFSHIFPGKATQNDVYNKCVQPLIGNILKGYNVSIMAYGQSGSGKTYTMGTHYNPDEQMGVIPRGIIEIFELARDHFSYDCKITVSFLEVFNDTVYDLFTRKPKDQSIVDNMQEDSWEGLTKIPANSAREVLNLLQKAVLKRACEPTPLSMNSSRSHAMFCLNIAMTHKTDKKESKNAKLLLIDLAAAENKDIPSKNGVNLVKNGLLALNRVIHCLSCGDTMDSVPYEDSILTRLLKDALGGNSKTLVITCISSSENNVEETISTLKMAIEMKKIKNQPVIQKDLNIDEVIDHTAVSSRSQNRTDSFHCLVLNGLSKLKNKMLEIVDDNGDLSTSTSENQIENGLGTTISGMDHQNKEFKQLQTLLTDLEEQLENINKKVKFNNHRLNELEHENDLLKENIKTLEITDKKNKTAKKTKVSKKQNKIIKKKMSRGSSRLSVSKIEDLLEKSKVESTDSPFGSKVTVRKNKSKKDESQLGRKTIDKENVDSSEEDLVEATKKSTLEERVLAEKRINANEEEGTTINKGSKKQVTALGCNCKLDCSRKQCGCKKIGKECDFLCKCKQSVCRNRNRNDNSLEMKETEESFEDGNSIKRKKTTKENIARKKKVL